MTRPAADDRFVQLLEAHKRILYKVANTYCADVEGRRDLVQEMVVHLWKSFPRYDDSFKFSTWMYRIAMNVAISNLRSEKPAERDAVSLDTVEIIDFAAADRVMGEVGDELRRLQQLIANLDAMNRALIVLHLEGHSHGEIAEILGITETNVGTRINRIKTRLQKDLALETNANA